MIEEKDPNPQKNNYQKKFKIVGSLFSTSLFIWLIWQQDWQTTWSSLSQIPVWLWPVCLVLIVAGMVCNAWRWYVLLRAQDVEMPFSEVVRTVFAGAFASNFLPSTIGGDAFRIVSLLQFTSDRALSVASVFVDRAVNVVATLSFLPFSLMTFGDLLFDLLSNSKYPLMFIGIFPFGEKILSAIREFVRKFMDTFKKWAQKPGVLFGALGISWISIVVVYIAVWLLAVYLGIPVTLFQVIGVAAVVYIVTLLPVSFNGYGVREMIYATLYMRLGATIEQATTLALVSRFFILIETIPGALWLSRLMSVQGSESMK